MGRAWVAALLGVLVGCGPQAIGEDWRRIEQVSQAPDFALDAIDGPPVRLSDLRGRVVIVEFWATWCGPCRMSTPSLNVIARRFSDQPVSVLLINAGETPDAIRDWLGNARYTARVLLDTTGEVREAYGVRGIPRLLILDREGRIAYDHSGYRGGLERNLTLILKQMLSETPPNA
jgi:thiol-disulfide isomerase/thioredoxin